MTDPAHAQAVALFRYGLIADLLHMPLGSRGLYPRLREKAALDYVIPGSSRTRVAAADAAPLAQGLPARRLRRAVPQGPLRPLPQQRCITEVDSNGGGVPSMR
jgi:hypothetical protein